MCEFYVYICPNKIFISIHLFKALFQLMDKFLKIAGGVLFYWNFILWTILFSLPTTFPMCFHLRHFNQPVSQFICCCWWKDYGPMLFDIKFYIIGVCVVNICICSPLPLFINSSGILDFLPRLCFLLLDLYSLQRHNADSGPFCHSVAFHKDILATLRQ